MAQASKFLRIVPVLVLAAMPLCAADLHKAADFVLPDLQGKKVHFSDFKGHVTLIDFWATWCVPCREELPDLKNIYAHYKAKGFTVVGVSLDDAGKAGVIKFVKDNAVPYPILLTGGTDQIPDGYNVEGLPMAYLVDAKGFIRKSYTGQIDMKEVEKDISQLLN